MAYNVSALTDYVNQFQDKLTAKSVLTLRSLKYLTVLPSVKYKVDLNIFNNPVAIQDGTNCGFSASGTLSFSQRELTVKELTVQESFCPKTLQTKYTQYYLKPGKNEDMPFEQEFTDDLTAQIANANEILVWQGDTSSTGSTSYIDGYLKIIAAASPITVSVSGLTSSNVIQVINNVFNAIPYQVQAKEDTKIFVGMDTFNLYTQALLANNNFHYDGKAADWTIYVPGTATQVVAVPGLNGTKKIVAASSSNLFYGTDVEDEESKVDIWFEKGVQLVYVNVDYKLGVQVKFPSEIVYAS